MTAVNKTMPKEKPAPKKEIVINESPVLDNDVVEVKPTKPLLRNLDEPVVKPKPTTPMPRKSKSNPAVPFLAALVIVGAGTFTGFGLSQAFGKKDIPKGSEVPASNLEGKTIKVGDIFGINDKEDFPDSAEGVLEVGGIEGEGSHKLLRPGGVSQNVYMTSAVVDLDSLVGHKVKVQGNTFAAQKAGWLMDVGKVEVLELNAPRPFEAE